MNEHDTITFYTLIGQIMVISCFLIGVSAAIACAFAGGVIFLKKLRSQLSQDEDFSALTRR